MTGKSAALAINIVADASRAVAAFDSTGDAGKKMAELIGKNADRLEKELEQTRKIAERLGQALGPELAARMGQGKVDDYARQMAKAGLSVEQVDDAAEDLARQLERLEVAAEQSGRRLQSGMADVRDETNRAADATKNFAGNAVGDFASMTAGIGPLGEAVGQLTERMLDGGVSLKNFASAGLGIGAIGIAMWGFERAAAQSAKRQQELNQAVEEFSKVTDRQALELYYRTLFNLALEGKNVNQYFEDFAYANMEGAKRLREIIFEAEGASKQFEMLSNAIGVAEQELRQGELTNKIYGEGVWEIAEATGAVSVAVEEQIDLVDLLDAAWDQFYGTLDKVAMYEDVWASSADVKMGMDERVRLVAQYVQEVLGMPPDAMDRFLFNLDQGNLEAAYRYLAIIERARSMMGAGWWTNDPGVPTGGAGGVRTQVVDGERYGTININMPAGADGAAVVAALQQWQRDNGAIPVTTTAIVVP